MWYCSSVQLPLSRNLFAVKANNNNDNDNNITDAEIENFLGLHVKMGKV
jgi:hypothetical protein